MTLKEDICDLLKEKGFYLKSIEGYSTQIFIKENVVVIVEEKGNEKSCEGSCCESGKGYNK